MESITKLKDLKNEFDNVYSCSSESSLGLNKNDYSNIGFMDIETTGLSPLYSKVTLVGLHSLDSTNIYIDSHNHNKAINDIDSNKYLVTFNGNRFDIPFLNSHYPMRKDFKSLDLMYLLRELGYRGGLKAIEQNLGLSRIEQVQGMSGKDAVGLWYEYKQGNTNALNKLINYNIEDIVNLEVLFNFVVKRTFNEPTSLIEMQKDKNKIMSRIKEKNSLNIWN